MYSTRAGRLIHGHRSWGCVRRQEQIRTRGSTDGDDLSNGRKFELSVAKDFRRRSEPRGARAPEPPPERTHDGPASAGRVGRVASQVSEPTGRRKVDAVRELSIHIGRDWRRPHCGPAVAVYGMDVAQRLSSKKTQQRLLLNLAGTSGWYGVHINPRASSCRIGAIPFAEAR